MLSIFLQLSPNLTKEHDLTKCVALIRDDFDEIELFPKLYVYITIRFVPSTAHSVGSYARCHFMCLSSNILSDT